MKSVKARKKALKRRTKLENRARRINETVKVYDDAMQFIDQVYNTILPNYHNSVKQDKAFIEDTYNVIVPDAYDSAVKMSTIKVLGEKCYEWAGVIGNKNQFAENYDKACQRVKDAHEDMDILDMLGDVELTPVEDTTSLEFHVREVFQMTLDAMIRVHWRNLFYSAFEHFKNALNSRVKYIFEDSDKVRTARVHNAYDTMIGVI